MVAAPRYARACMMRGSNAPGLPRRASREQRGGDIGGVHQRVGFKEREAQKSQHSLRAVEKRESFFRFQRDWSDPGALHRVRAIQNFALVACAAFTDDHLREVREWREIAGCANGALRGNHRMNLRVEHLAQASRHARANAAEAFCQSVGAQQHHGASFSFAERARRLRTRASAPD